jgi:hypothetical protein
MDKLGASRHIAIMTYFLNKSAAKNRDDSLCAGARRKKAKKGEKKAKNNGDKQRRNAYLHRLDTQSRKVVSLLEIILEKRTDREWAKGPSLYERLRESTA